MNTEDKILHCYIHPDRETLLRCNKCGRPICTSCAVLTPTGYRCKECIRKQQNVFNTALIQDYLFAGIIAASFSFLGSLLPASIGFFTLFLAPAVSWLILEATRLFSKGRRSKLLSQVILAATIFGCLPLLFLNLWNLLKIISLSSNPSIITILPSIWQAGYAFLLAATTYQKTHAMVIG